MTAASASAGAGGGAAATGRRAGDRDDAARLVTLLTGKEIVVCCGSGGVGKTSVAAALALAAAEHRTGKVLVLTVDPARRLATALGIGGIGNLERRVDPALLRASGIDARAEVWAAMLDTKQSWDSLVLRHAPDEQTAYRILHNRLYENLTARFVQSHDYIAIERLYELHSEGKYDPIIVDTPPSRNAVDFLDAPTRMSEFFGGRLLRWLTLPYRAGGGRGARVLNVASRPFYQVADRLIGSSFLQEIADFFLNFQSMYDGFVTRASAVEALLRDRRTTFAVVTTLEAAPLHEAEEFFTELSARSCATECCPTTSWRPRRSRPRATSRRKRAWSVSRSPPSTAVQWRNWLMPVTSCACCAPSQRHSATSRSSARRRSSCAPIWLVCPT